MGGSNVVSLSGGKDSTAMLLMLLERGEDIADIVFFDTGWEFPAMYEHLDKLENFIGRKITRLHARLPIGIETEKSPFDWWFSEKPIRKRGTDQVHRIGCAWPNSLLVYGAQTGFHSCVLAWFDPSSECQIALAKLRGFCRR